jgi:hypothetical protein
MPLDLYLEFVKNNQPTLGNNITMTQNFTVGVSIKAYKLNQTFVGGKVGFTILFNKNPQSYYISYQVVKDKYEKYLPLVNQMIKSFRFTGD